jgi:hypothetical protein
MDWINVAHERALLPSELDNESSGVPQEAGNILTRLATNNFSRMIM